MSSTDASGLGVKGLKQARLVENYLISVQVTALRQSRKD